MYVIKNVKGSFSDEKFLMQRTILIILYEKLGSKIKVNKVSFKGKNRVKKFMSKIRINGNPQIKTNIRSKKGKNNKIREKDKKIKR